MKSAKLVSLTMLLLLTLAGAVYAESADEERTEILKMSKETLGMLYKEHPQSKEKINSAYGYATFSNFGVNLIFFSAEGGGGVAHNNKTGKDTFMKMASGGVGLGLGAKDFRAIFIFDNKEVFDSFVNSGWEANAQADAAAQADEKGGSLDGSTTVQPGVHLYKLTKTGLALQATVQGTKYWKDDDLNK